MNLFQKLIKESDANINDASREPNRLEDSNDWFCGTPLMEDLFDAQEAFHAGLPVENGVLVEEIVLRFHADWKLRGRSSTMEGWEEIYFPRTDVEGEEEDIPMLSLESIDGFIPERGHTYRLRVRRFSIDRDPIYSEYELLEVLSDELAEG